MLLMNRMSTVDRLNHELDAVTGETCGWSCDHHATNFLPCQRAKDHAGGQVMVDVHVSRREDALTMATETCCETPPVQVSGQESTPLAKTSGQDFTPDS